MIIQTQEISKAEIMQRINSRKNEETISFEKAYIEGKKFINKLWKNLVNL